MNPAAIIDIITGLIPEIITLIKGNPDATDAEIIAQLNLDVNRITAISDAWLQSHPNA